MPSASLFCAASTTNQNIPSVRPTSPIRLTMNALLAAAEFLRSLYQKPMSR